jgi:hypothetical protein
MGPAASDNSGEDHLFAFQNVANLYDVLNRIQQTGTDFVIVSSMSRLPSLFVFFLSDF